MKIFQHLLNLQLEIGAVYKQLRQILGKFKTLPPLADKRKHSVSNYYRHGQPNPDSPCTIKVRIRLPMSVQQKKIIHDIKLFQKIYLHLIQ